MDRSGTVLRLAPMLEALSHRVVDAGTFALSGLSSEPEGYRAQVEGTLRDLETLVRASVGQLVGRSTSPPAFSRRPGTVHLEFGLPSEGTLALLDRVSNLLTLDGWQLTQARRWEASTTATLQAQTRADLAAACEAEVLLTLGDGADVDAEVAAVQGARTAAGRPTVLLRTAPLGLWDGPAYTSACNLMLAHSATCLAPSVAAAVGQVRALRSEHAGS